MTSSHKEFLTHFGWDDFFENQWNNIVSKEHLIPARVINEERNLYRVQLSFDEQKWTSISGKMKFNAQDRTHYPAVGDWVLVDFPPQSERGVIHHILERKTVLSRKQVGSVADVQILASNVDTVFITSSINNDLNIGRIERYLTFAWDSGALPVILLTKADLYTGDLSLVVSDLKSRFNNVLVYTTSKNNFDEADFFKLYLEVGKTAVLVGSSGVGKSTIGNFLIGSDTMAVQDIRGGDDKGRHTTTSRSLFVSIYGGLIIDSPGMRELQFADHQQGFEEQFKDVEGLIAKCRFNDCKHTTEPECAILEALDSGALDEVKWKSFRKIAAEIRHNARKQSQLLYKEDKKIWKKRSKLARIKTQNQRRGLFD